MAGGIALHQRHRTVQHLADVRGRQFEFHGPRKFQKARDQRVGAVHLRGDEPRHLARHFVLGGYAAGQHFSRSYNGTQRIAQLVRQARGELAQRGQPVRATHRLLGFAQVTVGFRQLFRHSAVFAVLHAQRLRQRVGEIPGHGQEDGP